MADLFGYNDVNWGGTFSADQATLSISGSAGDALIQNWSVTYSQNLQPVYVLGSNKVYYARQHAVGQIQIGRILSTDDVISKLGGNTCKGQPSVNISAGNGLCSTQGGVAQATISIRCSGVVLTQVSWSGQVQQAWVAENLQAYCASVSKS